MLLYWFLYHLHERHPREGSSCYKCQLLGSVVPSLSCVRLFATLWTVAHQDSLSFTISQSLLIFMPTESVTLSNHLILSCPLLLLPSIFPDLRNFSRCVGWSPGISRWFFFFFLFVVNFVIHWNETAMGLHVFPIPIPPPTSLSTHSP